VCFLESRERVLPLVMVRLIELRQQGSNLVSQRRFHGSSPCPRLGPQTRIVEQVRLWEPIRFLQQGLLHETFLFLSPDL
jgi:hypothetical protein